MNNRRWLSLLLSVSLTLAPRMTAAQDMPTLGSRARGVSPTKQSHHDLPGGFDQSSAQEMMAQRLRELREWHQLQGQVQQLLKDVEVVNNFTWRFPREKLQQIKEKILRGERLDQDRNLNQFIQKAASSQGLDQQKLGTLLRRWAERVERKPPPDPAASAMAPSPPPTLPDRIAPPPSAATPSFPSTAAPRRSLLGRIREETSKWMMDHLDEMSGETLEALIDLGGNDEGAPVNEWLRIMKQAEISGGNFAEQAAGLSNYLPKLSDFLPDRDVFWDEVSSLFREAPASSLPRFGASSSFGTADDGGWIPATLSVLIFSVFALLLRGMIRKSPVGSAEQTWRLGSWPVSPSGVSTRQDVIRAFEYLALLCLGPAAGTCHHRELAERLAERSGGNSSRRQAVETLAWLYEQARYAPADEALSEDELSDARYALCLLAGVTAV